MRVSQFWALMNDEFGVAYARSLAGSHVLHALDDRTAAHALDDGVPPRVVWLALCEDLDVPEQRRLGRDVRGRR